MPTVFLLIAWFAIVLSFYRRYGPPARDPLYLDVLRVPFNALVVAIWSRSFDAITDKAPPESTTIVFALSTFAVAGLMLTEVLSVKRADDLRGFRHFVEFSSLVFAVSAYSAATDDLVDPQQKAVFLVAAIAVFLAHLIAHGAPPPPAAAAVPAPDARRD